MYEGLRRGLFFSYTFHIELSVPRVQSREGGRRIEWLSKPKEGDVEEDSTETGT